MSEWRVIERPVRDVVGEGPIWSARQNAILWTDIYAPAVNRFSLTTGEIERFPMPQKIGWIIEREKGGYIAGFQRGFAELDLDPVAIRMIGDPEPEFPANRANDAKADNFGNIWSGTLEATEQVRDGSVYRLKPDLTWEKMGTGYLCPNGPAFSSDGKWMYLCDSMDKVVYRFPREGENIGPREVFTVFDGEMGEPDGMTMDTEGGLWIASFGGGRVMRFHESGKVDRVIKLPAHDITSVVFGGEKLDRMFVTSAHILRDNSIYDGALFEVDCGMVGVAPDLFAG